MAENAGQVVVTEAQRLRDLGRFPEAERCYRQAQEQRGDLYLSIELAGMYLEEGGPRNAQREFDAPIERPDSSPQLLKMVLIKMLRLLTKAATAVVFSGVLDTAVELYNQHLLNLQVDDFDKPMVDSRPRALPCPVVTEQC